MTKPALANIARETIGKAIVSNNGGGFAQPILGDKGLLFVIPHEAEGYFRTIDQELKTRKYTSTLIEEMPTGVSIFRIGDNVEIVKFITEVLRLDAANIINFVNAVQNSGVHQVLGGIQKPIDQALAENLKLTARKGGNVDILDRISLHVKMIGYEIRSIEFRCKQGFSAQDEAINDETKELMEYLNKEQSFINFETGHEGQAPRKICIAFPIKATSKQLEEFILFAHKLNREHSGIIDIEKTIDHFKEKINEDSIRLRLIGREAAEILQVGRVFEQASRSSKSTLKSTAPDVLASAMSFLRRYINSPQIVAGIAKYGLDRETLEGGNKTFLQQIIRGGAISPFQMTGETAESNLLGLVSAIAPDCTQVFRGEDDIFFAKFDTSEKALDFSLKLMFDKKTIEVGSKKTLRSLTNGGGLLVPLNEEDIKILRDKQTVAVVSR